MMWIEILILVLVLLFLIVYVFFGLICRKSWYEYWDPTTTRGIGYVEKPLTASEIHRWAQISMLILVPVYNMDITNLRRRVNLLTSGSRDWKIYIYGLDSTIEKTKTQLSEWTNEDPEHVVLVPPHRDERPKNRPVRIGRIRSEILSYARKAETNLSRFDIAMVYDGDLTGPVSKRGLLEACEYLARHSDVYAVAASGGYQLIPGGDCYYDTYALRNLAWHGRPILFFDADMYWRQILPYEHKLKSAFNGACLYRWSELCQIERYPPIRDVCEHVALHRELERQFPQHTHMVVLDSFHLYAGVGQPQNW